MLSAPPTDSLVSDNRIAEIAEILAAGLMRLRARKSRRISADCGKSSLDCAGTQSGHANALKTGRRRAARRDRQDSGGWPNTAEAATVQLFICTQRRQFSRLLAPQERS